MSTNFINEFCTRVGYGSIDGVASVRLTGINGAITTTAETLWDESTVYAFLAANMATPTISSDSANDAAAGTGARTVSISGVDANFAIQSETLILNGTTGVSLVNSYMSINNMTVLTAGSGGVNAGIIYVGTGSVTAGKPAVVHGLIAATRNASTSFIYTVPSGYTLMMKGLVVGSRSVTAGGHEVNIISITNGGIKTLTYVNSFQNLAPLYDEMYIPLRFPEKTQLQGMCLAGAGTGPVYGVGYCMLSNNTFGKL